MAYHISIADIAPVFRDYKTIDPYNLGRIRHDNSNIKPYQLRSEVYGVCWRNPLLKNLCIRFDKRRDQWLEEQERISLIIEKSFLLGQLVHQFDILLDIIGYIRTFLFIRPY
jgi:hypothetical protein